MPQKVLASILEDKCIGCTKCIDVCPTDAILGATKHMHTVIEAECIGCKLCVPVCPVDCIELVTTPDTHTPLSPEQVKQRYQARKQRLEQKNQNYVTLNTSLTSKHSYIQEALLRAKKKG